MERQSASQAHPLFWPQAVSVVSARRALFGCQMKSATVLLASALAMPFALAGQRSCPKLAPAEWGVGPQALESVRVMSYPVNVAPNPDREYYATPPWFERENGGYIYQTWYVNRDTADFKYEVDCVYGDSERYLRLDVAGMRQCVARWRARRDHGVVARSLDFSCK